MLFINIYSILFYINLLIVPIENLQPQLRSPEIPQTSCHYGIEGFKEDSIMPRGVSCLDLWMRKLQSGGFIYFL